MLIDWMLIELDLSQSGRFLWRAVDQDQPTDPTKPTIDNRYQLPIPHTNIQTYSITISSYHIGIVIPLSIAVE